MLPSSMMPIGLNEFQTQSRFQTHVSISLTLMSEKSGLLEMLHDDWITDVKFPWGILWDQSAALATSVIPPSNSPAHPYK